MSEILERVRQQIAESYRVCPPPCPVDERRRELAEERERQARKAREAEEKQQVASNNWYAAVDDRINEHLKNWLWGAIDDRIRQNLEHHFFSGDLGVGGAVIGGLKDALGEIVEKFRAQVQGLKADSEKQQCSFEAKLTEQKERLNNSVDGAQGRLREEVRQAIKEMCGEFGAQLAALEQRVEQRVKAVPGRLPVAKLWQPDSVTYEAQVVSYDGSLYQARKDTAQMPGGSDWVCVARAGRDGCDGRTLNFRGGFDGYREYQQFDVIEFDGSSFIAVRDLDPGTIPGEDGWQLLCRPGSRGPVGDDGLRGRKGERGARGADAPTIVSWSLDRKNYRAVPTMSNGQAGAPLDLRGLFEQYLLETSAATPS